MDEQIISILSEKHNIRLLQDKLPKLFEIAEIDSSRAGTIGMEVGNLRERIIVAYFMVILGEGLVNYQIPTTEPETDLIIAEVPVSIKTKTGKGYSGVKLAWTVDPEKAKLFVNTYKPTCPIIFIQIDWESQEGGFFFIPIEVQKKFFEKLGRDKYLKLPKPGTNPRGIEIHFKTLLS